MGLVLRLPLALLAPRALPTSAAGASGAAGPALREAFADLLPFPGHAGSGAFSDLGAWHGFALPDAGSEGGFAGPFVHSSWLPGGGHWLSPSALVRFVPGPADGSAAWPPREANASFLPGLLRHEWRAGPLRVVSELAFVGPRTAAVRSRAVSEAATGVRVAPAFSGEAVVELAAAGPSEVTVAASAPRPGMEDAVFAAVRFDPAAGVAVRPFGRGYRASARSALLEPGGELVSYYTVSVALNRSERQAAAEASAAFFRAPAQQLAAAAQRWDRVVRLVAGNAAGAEPSPRQRVAVKAACTLVLDWRGATGAGLLHDGCSPTIAGGLSGGMWSWDSWKHAAGLSVFDTALGASQVRAMFDYQGKTGAGFVGMVPDKISLPPDIGAAWGNTKPPLAAWGTAVVYARSQDMEFLREMFPKLEAFHAWWYEWRDHDQNGLCEFGASGNDTQGMKWESGMDNAPRFDSTSMLRNADQAWSADQESVDLNAFLYLEKLVLASFADVLGNASLAAAYRRRAAEVRELAQERFFDPERGYFFDRRLGADGGFVGPMGCEGFAALFSGLASPEQAARVREHLVDPRRFGTAVPFGSVAADAPEFDQDGYWRGPTWLDQAYFAHRGLLRYGYAEEAGRALSALMEHAEGLGVRDISAPFTENYSPLTGKRSGAEWFGWSAALLLLLTAPAPPGELPADLLPHLGLGPSPSPVAGRQRLAAG